MPILSESWLKAKKFIPNGAQTLSKRPETYCSGSYPKMLLHGHGCEVFDEEDISYIDYISGLGTNLIGYNDIVIDDAVKQTINGGQVLLSLPHPKESELASKLCSLNGMDKVKFFKTGSEATSAAVRIARAYTGRNSILKCGYNGWHDWAMIRSTRRDGIPLGLEQYTDTFEYNNLKSLEAAFHRASPVAAVILEPIVYEEPKDDFLQKLVDLARSKNALVIFDEVVTGMRFGLSGASGLFGIKPDLLCFGKSLGNGYAISGVIGNDRHMEVFEHDSFIASGTFSGDLIGISAAIAVLENYDPKKLWANGLALKLGFNKLCQELGIEASCIGYAPRTKFEFPSIEHRALFWQECVKRGVLFGYTNFVTVSHGPRIIETTLKICSEALTVLKENWANPKSKIVGELPKVVL